MRLNEKELNHYSCGPAVKEGRIQHKIPNASFREGYKERWFKLMGNLLFYYRVNQYGGVHHKEPAGVLVIELCKVQTEDDSPLPFAFSLCFDCDSDRKHFFGCPTQSQCDEWVALLSEASYQSQRIKLSNIRSKIMEITGTDPLASYSYQI